MSNVARAAVGPREAQRLGHHGNWRRQFGDRILRPSEHLAGADKDGCARVDCHGPDTTLGPVDTPLAERPLDVLFLCTGNICRSPMAEALLQRRLTERGIAARVHSAGMLYDGRPVSEPSVAVLAARGLDIAAHVSRKMIPGFLEDADLILGMARTHVREAVVSHASAWPRSFTMKELVRRGEEVGQRIAGESLADWLDRVHAGRAVNELLGDSDEDDIFDPFGLPQAVYERTAVEISDLVDRLVAIAFATNAPGTNQSAPAEGVHR